MPVICTSHRFLLHFQNVCTPPISPPPLSGVILQMFWASENNLNLMQQTVNKYTASAYLITENKYYCKWHWFLSLQCVILPSMTCGYIEIMQCLYRSDNGKQQITHLLLSYLCIFTPRNSSLMVIFRRSRTKRGRKREKKNRNIRLYRNRRVKASVYQTK